MALLLNATDPLDHHHAVCGHIVVNSPDSTGQRSELLEEAEHKVPECSAQWLVVVTHDVCCVVLQLDESVLGLQVQDVTVWRLLHFHLCDSALVTNKKQKREEEKEWRELVKIQNV